MELSALTRSVVKENYAVICPDGYINSKLPGWDNCSVNVIINYKLGANLCQTLVTANSETRLTGLTVYAEIFFYVVDGSVDVIISGESTKLKTGGFIYIPPGKEYSFSGFEERTKLLTFHKKYEPLEAFDKPGVQSGNALLIESQIYLNDPALKLQCLLPDNLAFDLAVNIFTYQPGGHLPMVETHVMEHGLFYLQGQGIYRLGQDWYPIKAGDSIWMAPYCQQWFTAMGKEPAIYIYYKDVNRFPISI